MHLNHTPKRTLALFCKVVDNYGDIGICWRLARQLQQEHDIAVTLWVDDLVSFQKICPEVNIHHDQQQVAGVQLQYWKNQDGAFMPADVADIVIEFFACDIPPGYIAAMAQCEPRPVWLNLEGLTAEEWVEGCHTLPSPHPSYSLTKYFFYPGFTNKTGGLLLESTLGQQRQQFQSDPAAMMAFLAPFGVTPTEMQSIKVSLFCYPQAPVVTLFEAWQSNHVPVTCLVPQGVAIDAVETWMVQAASVGASATRGALTVRVLPFIPQPEYDQLLWACDLNFVRGEDSFVRAQWAERPFIWHIYPQDENLHHKKLRAFLQRYATELESLNTFSLAWNGAGIEPKECSKSWQQLQADMPKIAEIAIQWNRQMLNNGDFASNLMTFIKTVC